MTTEQPEKPPVFLDSTMLHGFDAVRALLSFFGLCVLGMPGFLQGFWLAVAGSVLWQTREPARFDPKRGRLW